MTKQSIGTFVRVLAIMLVAAIGGTLVFAWGLHPQDRSRVLDVVKAKLEQIQTLSQESKSRTRSDYVIERQDQIWEIAEDLERIFNLVEEDRPTDPGTRPPPVDPGTRPPPVDPGTRPPPDMDNGWPEDVPFEVPGLPSYTVPTLWDCDWTVSNGVFTSRRGLPTENTVRDAYRASMAARHDLPIRFGVWDNMGWAVGAGVYNGDAHQSITAKDSSGNWRKDISFEIVGLTDNAEVTLGWTDDFGAVKHMGIFNIGLRGQPAAYLILANDGIDTAIFDGCWFLSYPGMTHMSGIHMNKWRTLVLRNWKFKGTLLNEHLFYLKSCVGDQPGEGTFIVNNDLRGGNRTGFQIRPENPQDPRPKGPIVVAYNKAHGYGWTHDGKDGGGCLTTWVGPESPVYVFGNEITDARYSALVVSGQGSSLNWLSASGHAIESVYLWGNTFENARADRACVTVSATGEVHFYGKDSYDGGINGDLILDNTVNMGYNGILNGLVAIHGSDTLNYLKSLDVRTFDPQKPGANKPMDVSEFDGWVVATEPNK